MTLRRFLVLAVIANLLAFAWWHGDLDPLLGSAREPERMRQQVDAERIRLLPGERTTATPGTAPAGTAATSAAAPGGTAADEAAATSAAPAPTAAAARPDVCREIGPLEETRSRRVRAAVAGLAAWVRADAEVLTDSGTWMVYVPPSDDLQAAQRRQQEFRRLGIQDTYLMPDGPFKYGISFGLFRSEDGARSLAESLARQGVRGIRVALRSANETKTVFRLHTGGGDAAPPADVQARLTALFDDLGVNPVPCAPRPER